MEKGLDVFADAIDALAERKVKHRVLVIGEGPGAAWFEERLPDAIFIGQLAGADLARALASADVFLNPSITETFGNVTLEAMACALPVVAAVATGATNLVRDGETGTAGRRRRRRRLRRCARGLCRATRRFARRHGEAGLAFAETMDWDRINSAVLQDLPARDRASANGYARLTGR